MSMSSVTMIPEVNQLLEDLSVSDQNTPRNDDTKCGNGKHEGICAICLNKMVLEEMALIKGCEHAYCVTCILRWASYKEKATCPQCKYPFEFLHIHRALDGSLHDYMFEESVCLLLRAPWFKPLEVQEHEHNHDNLEEDYIYEDYDDQDDDLDEVYFRGSSIRIGNRRWGDNGYVRAGRQEARPVNRPCNPQNAAAAAASSSRQQKQKEEVAKEVTGRRAKRAQKREAADKAAAANAAAKHQQHLARLGRK